MVSPNSQQPFADHYILFKPVANCESEGCHMLVWEPKNVTEGKSCPIAVFIHGGAFTAGSAADLPNQQLNYLLEKGFVCVSLEYRMLPQVDYYACRRDVLEGYKFVQNSLQAKMVELGSGIKLDIERCIAIGGSAGGTLVVTLSADIVTYNSDPLRTPLPQLKAILPAYPLTNVNTHWVGTRLEYFQKMEKEDPKLLEVAKKAYTEKICVSKSFGEVGEGVGGSGMRRGPPGGGRGRGGGRGGRGGGGHHDAGRPNENGPPKKPMTGPPPMPENPTPREAWMFTTMRTQCHNSFLVSHDPPYPPSASCINDIFPLSAPCCILAASEDKAIPVSQSYELLEAYKKNNVECLVLEAKGAGHAYTDLPFTWPEGVDWWEGVIEKGLEWVVGKVEE